MTDADKRAKIGAGLPSMPLLGTVFDHHWDRESELTTLGTIGARGDREGNGRPAARIGQDPAERASRAGAVRLRARARRDRAARGRRVRRRRQVFLPRRRRPGADAPDALARCARDDRARDRPRRNADAAPHRGRGRMRPHAGHRASRRSSTRDASGLQTRALFTGGLRETVRRAAEISQQVHVRYTGRRYKRVVAILDEHYDELWVGGKASYKLGGIIERGGELIIYAPHLSAISSTHGRADREVRLRAARAGARHGRGIRRTARQPLRRRAPRPRRLRGRQGRRRCGRRRATASRSRPTCRRRPAGASISGYLDMRTFEIPGRFVTIRTRSPSRTRAGICISWIEEEEMTGSLNQRLSLSHCHPA